ncbi:MAG: hypothetical protein N2Z80_07475 [Hydrogenothermaceae bacterium]|nr:hypothetical protein [Hydrogenothermaceae bacterium]
MKKKLSTKVLLGVIIISSVALVSCGGGSGSTGGNTSGNLASANPVPLPSEKTAYLNISVPALAERLNPQLISEDTYSIRVEIVQFAVSQDNVVCSDYPCSLYRETVTLTPQVTSKTVALFPMLTQICIYQNQQNSTSYYPSICGYAELKSGNNNLTYTLLRGSWSLPGNKDIAGLSKFLVKSYKNPYYYGYYGKYYGSILDIVGYSDITFSNINGIYTQLDYTNGGRILLFGKEKTDRSYDGFASYDGRSNFKNIEIKYAWGKYVKREEDIQITIKGKNNQDVTSGVLENCQFSTTDGKSISGCLVKGAKRSTESNYDYKIEIKHIAKGPNICYTSDRDYDSTSEVCFDYYYYYIYNPNTNTYEYRCSKQGFTYNSSMRRCEASLKSFCESYQGGTYNQNVKTCENAESAYYTVSSIEKVTLTGSPSASLPSSGNITVQQK